MRSEKGGIFRISLALRNLDSIDPALAYVPASWLLLDATCAKLVNYPDQNAPAGLRAVPEAAARNFRISNNGRKYTFRIRPGFRFSDKTKLTARSFQRAIERLADPDMESPAAFVAEYVQEFVGADQVLAGKTTKLSGVVANGNELVIRLKRRVPDFIARLAMPFFCAVPPDLPANPEGAREYASAGPYYVDEYLPGRRVTLQQNPYYGGKRPQRVNRFEVTFTSTGIEVVDKIEAGTADWGWISTPAWTARGDGAHAEVPPEPEPVATPDPPVSGALLLRSQRSPRDLPQQRATAPRSQFRRQPGAARQAAGSRRGKRGRPVPPARNAGVQGRADLPVPPEPGQGAKAGEGAAPRPQGRPLHRPR